MLKVRREIILPHFIILLTNTRLSTFPVVVNRSRVTKEPCTSLAHPKVPVAQRYSIRERNAKVRGSILH